MNKSILDLIVRKRDSNELSAQEIGRFVSDVVSARAPDYQIGAMLMAIYLRGMSDTETANLTSAMVQSGEVIDLSSIDGFKADKHSTGGSLRLLQDNWNGRPVRLLGIGVSNFLEEQPGQLSLL
jgi:thymidine phosphorylase